MTKDEVISTLRAALFGLVARDQAGPDSDSEIDVDTEAHIGVLVRSTL